MVQQILGDRIDQALRATLDGLAARQRVAANNIANADTPGFKASAVLFEERLQNALTKQAGTLRMAATRPGHIDPRGVDPTGAELPVVTQSDSSMRADGNSVDVDREMVQLAETAITYNAVAQLTASRLALLRSIITEGRR